MPIIYDFEPSPGLRLGVWRIEEEETFFLDKITQTDYDRSELAKFSNATKRKEWLASRYLIKHLIGRPEVIDLRKDIYNKPFIEGESIELSISHCADHAAAYISNKAEVGIDIEEIHPKVGKIKERFLSVNEMTFLNANTEIEQLVLMWSAKESMYKLHGKKRLEFRSQLLLEPFELSESGLIRGSIQDAPCEVHYRRIDDCFLTWASA